jgi:hypothetical protein
VKDSVELSSVTADALDALCLVGYVGRVNSPENMAWLFFLLRELPDDEKTFPHGKWATIQHIEGQLEEIAKVYAEARP